jgi:hypothetical protein
MPGFWPAQEEKSILTEAEESCGEAGCKEGEEKGGCAVHIAFFTIVFQNSDDEDDDSDGGAKKKKSAAPVPRPLCMLLSSAYVFDAHAGCQEGESWQREVSR